MRQHFTIFCDPKMLIRTISLFFIAILTAIPVQPLLAGGYVDGSVALEAATAINTGAVSVTPTFNNDQFNDKILVGTVNNDQIRTPSTADPVSTVTGNNYHDETDIRIPGRNGLDYVFTRTYNSAPTSTSIDRGIGAGWVHSYGMRLRSKDFGVCPNCAAAENTNGKTSSITYTDERGGEQNFLVNETSFAVTNPKGVYDTLTLDSAPGQHTLTFRNGTKYTFEVISGNLKVTPNLTARLKFIDNPWGDRLTLAYDNLGRLASVTDNLGVAGRTGLVFTYYASNRLQSVNDWTGRFWYFGYTGSDLTAMLNPLDQLVSYTYEPGHLLHEVIQPLQRNGRDVKTTFNYYRNGKTFNYHNALGHTETLSYDLYRKSTRVTDPRGGVREYSYDSDGRMTKLAEPDGAVLIFENQGDGIRSKKYDALGYATTYSYRLDRAFTGTSNSFGNVTRERDALNHDTDTSYGIFDQANLIKDKNGRNRRFTYATATTATPTACGDVIGKLKEARADLNGQLDVLLTQYTYDAFGNPCVTREYIDAGNTARYRQTDWFFDANDLYLDYKVVHQSGNFSLPYLYIDYTYDNLGRMVAEILYNPDPNDSTSLFQTTSYQYDALDRVTMVSVPNGDIRETVYDDNGQVFEENAWHRQPDNTYIVRTQATHQYDAADRRISTTDVLGNTTNFGYDEAGNLTKVTDANGHVTQYEYDAMNRPTAVIDGNGQRTETKYDLKGQPIAVTNANGETTKSEYDAVGRLTKVINPLGFETRFSYDANGNQTCVMDANATSLVTDLGHQPVNAQGCTETRVYDELNRLIQTRDAQNNVTATTYDLLGNRKTITDAEGRTTTFVYDDLGRMTALIDPLVETPVDKVQTFVHDLAGNVIEATDRKGQVTRYRYDRLNRNTQVLHLADGSTETAFYDSFGDLRQTQNAAVTYTYAYNTKHQLIGKADSRSTRTLGWSYDPVGNIDAKVDYQGDITEYQYDSANRLVAETNPAYLQVSYHYDLAGRLLDRILSNGARTHYGWDAAGRLTQLANTTATGQSVNSTTYTRDRIGNILTQAESNPPNSIAYSYDPEYRLLTANQNGTANDEAYGYDKVGNRKVYTKGALIPIASSRYYNYNAGNWLIDTRTGSATGTVFESYGYDFNGSLTSISGNRSLTLTWDADNRVKQVGSSTFNYDPSDYRIKKVGTTTKNYYLEGEHLEAIYDNAGIVQAQYFRGSIIDEVVNGYLKDNTNKLINYTFHHDALQSVLGLSGHEGSVLNTQAYSPFGASLSQTGTNTNSLQYTGREIDSETGFYYYRARYYDPVIGRFISEDPLGFGAGVNFYAYVDNNPVNANDPSGLDPLSAIAKLGGRLGNAATRALNEKIAKQYLDTGQYVLKSGGGKAEQLIPNAVTGGAKGGAFGDIVLKNTVTGQEVIINTVTTRANGLPTAAELAAAAKIQNLRPDSQFIMISKTTGAVIGAFAAGSASANTGILGTGITANGIGNFIADFLTPGGLGTAGDGSSVTPQSGSFVGGAFKFGGSANGGFLLYPNKSNTNTVLSVYSK